MPEENYIWLPRRDILSFEEIHTLMRCFATLGVERLRLTGGEPLLRRGLPDLVRRLRTCVSDVALTTNAVLLPSLAEALLEAGLQRITISLDTLRAERFAALTGRDDLQAVLLGLDAARQAGFAQIKINTVVIRGFNDDELVDLIEYCRPAQVRFIEYMDVGGATLWRAEGVVARSEILDRLEKHYGKVLAIPRSNAPAEQFALADGTTFGIIASTTAPFCRSCDRARLTADGVFYTCLYGDHGIDLRTPLRLGASREEITARLAATWRGRADKGAEERLALQHRGPWVQLGRLRHDPHLEMHTRGG